MGNIIGTGSQLSPFGGWLNELLEKRQLTAAQLAQMLNVSPGMLSRYMRFRMPPPRRWQEMISTLNLSPEEIAAGEQAGSKPMPEGFADGIPDSVKLRRLGMPLVDSIVRSITRQFESCGWSWEMDTQRDIVPFWLKVFHQPASKAARVSVLINLGDHRHDAERMHKTAIAQKAVHGDVKAVLFLYPLPDVQQAAENTGIQQEWDFSKKHTGKGDALNIVHFGNLIETLTQYLPAPNK